MARQARAEKARIQRQARPTKLAQIIRGGATGKVMKFSLSQRDLMVF